MESKQNLVLFEGILNSADIMFNQPLLAEINKLVKYVFGEPKMLIEKKDKEKEIQLWCGKELEKTVSRGYGQSYDFKSEYELCGEGFSGPLKGWLLEPAGCWEDSIIVLTCEKNGTFKNPRYVCGLVMNVRDVELLSKEL